MPSNLEITDITALGRCASSEQYISYCPRSRALTLTNSCTVQNVSRNRNPGNIKKGN